jgi:4-hydroxybenzoate polyprenyltransferase
MTPFEDVRRLLRSFPYSEYLFSFLPFMIYVAYTRNLPWFVVLQLVPFVVAIAAGFMYNMVCDAPYDSAAKNPVSEGSIRRQTVLHLSILLAAGSIILYLPFVQSPLSVLVLVVYVVLWFAYSGAGLRLKETAAGPLVASWVLWCGGPAVLLTNYAVYDKPLLLLWASLFLFYTGNEINHQIGDYKEDYASSVKTFTVRVGLQVAIFVRYCTVVASILLFSWSISRPLELSSASVLVVALVLFACFAVLDIIAYRDIIARFLRTGSLEQAAQEFKKTSRWSPFVIMKPLLVLFLVAVIGIDIWLGLAIFWILLSSKRT